MRLLFLTETIPFPLDSGGRIKTFNTLQILSKEHEVHCHALVRDSSHLRFERDLRSSVASLVLHLVRRSYAREARAALSSLPTGVPFVVRRHFHRAVLDRVRQHCREHAFDAVYCDHLSMLEYGRRLGLPMILDAHNVEYQIVRRYAATLGPSPLRAFAEIEWRQLQRYERKWYPHCRLIFVVSSTDEKSVRELAGDEPMIAVAPIAVAAAQMKVVEVLNPEPEILFVGGLHWPPNADAVLYFIQDIFPLVRKAVPKARFTVVGRGAEHIVRRVGAVEGVRFEGHVDDVEQYFRRSRVTVVPIRSGSGMRVKILDGMARGVPTVTTTIGCEGIDVDSEKHVLKADDPATFAASVGRVLRDDATARMLATEGRKLALSTYDTGAIADRVLGALKSMPGG